MDEKLIARFWGKVERRGPDECWEWTGARWVNGYGVIRIPGTRKNIGAHRLSLWISSGEHPGDLAVCHKCDNPPCCNPTHLFLGTLTENNTDMRLKGRGASPPKHGGVSHPKAKLTESQVRGMRAAATSGVTVLSLSRLYGIDRKTIYELLARRTWAHVS